MPWRDDLMQSRIDKALDNYVMDSFNITIGRLTDMRFGDRDFRCSSDVINGLLGRMLMQDIHPDGLNELKLSYFGEEFGDLDQDIIDQLFYYSQYLTKLDLSVMGNATE